MFYAEAPFLTRQEIYKAIVFFEVSCEKENEMAQIIINRLQEIANVIETFPDITNNSEDAETIRNVGFRIEFTTECSTEELLLFFKEIINFKDWRME